MDGQSPAAPKKPCFSNHAVRVLLSRLDVKARSASRVRWGLMRAAVLQGKEGPEMQGIST